ncbi:hypothetical protein [uncultured Deefgea sp.]|uniref:hypothetical protein n=1 Tax=uncultured Deefgea sp. TaxID=1304914 RepID=UPI00259631AD|nr:hypothetical protein [uncultured Deefgea sp.]
MPIFAAEDAIVNAFIRFLIGAWITGVGALFTYGWIKDGADLAGFIGAFIFWLIVGLGVPAVVCTLYWFFNGIFSRFNRSQRP